DVQHAEAVDRRDGAATGADRVDVQHGHGEVAPFDLSTARQQSFAVFDQCDVAGGSAHVEGDDVAQGVHAAGEHARGDAAGGPRKRGGEGAGAASPNGRHPAVRLHDVFAAGGDPGAAQAAVELRDIAREDRLQIGVDDGGAQPIILADLR